MLSKSQSIYNSTISNGVHLPSTARTAEGVRPAIENCMLRACPPSFWRSRTQEQIAEVVRISQGRVAQIINNTNFGEINNLLTQGREMDYIARHYHMDLALV